MIDREEGLREQGKRLAAWRAAQTGANGKRLSQVEAARRIGASQGAWAAWEKGRKAPDAYFADLLETLTKGRAQVRAAGWRFRRACSTSTPVASEAVARSA